MPDAVVIGAGPNGLVAANLLADQGWSVVVLERQDRPGGAVQSAELMEPGYVTDLYSAFYPLAKASPVLAGLGLEGHGLRWKRGAVALAHPSADDGTCPIISADLEETCASLDAEVGGDGDAWRRLYERWTKSGPGLLQALLSPFPPVRGALRLAGSMSPRKYAEFARFAMLPVRRLGEEEFRGEGGRRLLAGNALHADFAPESSISGLFGWLLCMLAQQVGFPVPEGGAGQLTASLVRRLQSLGGTIRCGADVERVVLRAGRAVGVRLVDGTEVDATRAVVADVAAPALYLRLVGEEHTPTRVLDGIRRFQQDQATVKVDWNLDGPIPWKWEDARRSSVVHVADSVDQLTITTAQMTTGLLPERPFLLVGQQSTTDPTRQPAGKETAWGYTHVPQQVKGDAAGDLTGSWSEAETAAFADRMENEIERWAPGFRSLVRRRHVATPVSLEADNPNLIGGATNGGTAQLHQQLIFRPVPGLGRPETPIKGLFLGSASAHPGGGVHGACGANAAHAALAADTRRRLLKR